MKHFRLRPRARVIAPAFAALALASSVAGIPSDTRAGTPPTYSIDFHTITGGGIALASTCYRLSGTIGQAAPGYSSGSTYSLIAGFWTAEVAASDEIFFNGFQGC